eukprot:CAMPEP_0182451828 /NCGR_PEP_ID=MMETSP1172-20130603/43931_1 /TAXON_ID=708627 /ORGANISM="Timspurckia oligopyrenoides, Strain CCMP3278" /LENGTH=216 /DNA_ID=CAMNT_0024649633 /DNA_START=393 /DNA_END=1039 /DNA_ORIENTATION=+
MSISDLEKIPPAKAELVNPWFFKVHKILKHTECSGAAGARLMQLIKKFSETSPRHEKIANRFLRDEEVGFWEEWKSFMVDRLRGQTGFGEDDLLLSSVMNCMAALNLMPDKEWVRCWFHSAGEMKAFGPQALGNSIHALAKMGIHKIPSAFKEHWDAQAKARMDEFTEQDMSLALWGLARLRIRSKAENDFIRRFKQMLLTEPTTQHSLTSTQHFV